MSLLLKPHSVTVIEPEQGVDELTGKVGSLVHPGVGATISCKVEPISAEDAFNRYGAEVRRGYRLMCELEDERLFPLNALVTWDGAPSGRLRVKATKRHTAFWDTAHGSVLLEEETA